MFAVPNKCRRDCSSTTLAPDSTTANGKLSSQWQNDSIAETNEVHFTARMAKSDLPLNSIYLKNRVAELDLKQWWLAEQIGVDRKTVIRWVQGQVKSIQPDNAHRLSVILECSIDDLICETKLLATPEDQKTAAIAISTSSILEKLGPIGEWNIVESLLKATIVPDLPLNILGELYNQLTVASWRQSKIDQAAVYNSKTEEIARKTDDRALLASALLSKANIRSWRGQTNDSITAYSECLNLERYITLRVRGSIHSNLGSVLYESGDLTAGEAHVRTSVGIFRTEGKPMNLCISHIHLVIIHLQRDELIQAEQEFHLATKFAQQDDYRRGVLDAKLLLGEIEARRGNQKRAVCLIDQSIDGLNEMGIVEGLSFEIAGRSYRKLGDLKRSNELIEKGISITNAFPVYQAALYFELAETQRLQGAVEWPEAANQAISLYERHQCPLRVQMIRSHVTSCLSSLARQ